METPLAAPRIVEGRLFALFSFDVGYEIDLDRLRREEPESARAGAGATRKATPARVQYPSPPLVVPLPERRVTVGGRAAVAQASLRVHEFGAVTVVLAVPLADRALDELPRLTAGLIGDESLEAVAREVLREAFPRIAPAVARPEPTPGGLVEDYHVLQIARCDPDVAPATLLQGARDLLAQTLHCEPLRLSPTEVDDVLRTAVTYTPDDLVVTDWNVALILDDEWEDVLNVLELLNVQLVELRFLDGMLDRRIAGLYEHVARPPGLFSFRRETARVRELAELWLDTVSLRERLVNALKLLGDLYLTKIYTRTAERLHLAQWQRSVDGKLELAQRISDVFTTRAATARAELLELAIVVLIVVEIVLFLPF